MLSSRLRVPTVMLSRASTGCSKDSATELSPARLYTSSGRTCFNTWSTLRESFIAIDTTRTRPRMPSLSRLANPFIWASREVPMTS